MTNSQPLEIIFCGGAEEIGANSCYINFYGTGVVIDAGLHPRKRDATAFPDYSVLEHKPVDYCILTHAHTDHIGALPLLLKMHPHIKILSSLATRDICKIMLADTVKIVQKTLQAEMPKEYLSLYNKKILAKADMIIEGKRYNEEFTIVGMGYDSTPVNIIFYPAGHILGASSVRLEANGFAILHSGDIQFRNQELLSKAQVPRNHVDLLIMESTHGSEEELPAFYTEKQRLAQFINSITTEGGSVLIPVFALGKSQEVLTILHQLMESGKIPHLPLYTGGMTRKLSIQYDRYCYTTPRIHPGFEISDIPQIPIDYQSLPDGEFLRKPSIVVTTSGMMNKGTVSHNLAFQWFLKQHFGIAIVGYQDPDTPGYALQHSVAGEKFEFGGKKVLRKCKVEKFRFSAHSPRDLLLEYAIDTQPNAIMLHHGDVNSIENIAMLLKERLPKSRIFIPTKGKTYLLG